MTGVVAGQLAALAATSDHNTLWRFYREHRQQRGIVVARLDRSIRQLVWGYGVHRVDAWTDQGIVYVVGKYIDTNE